MHKGRIEAYTDAVIAILITIMVLEFKIPHEANRAALHELLPVFISYVLSFIFISIYRNNHHHTFQVIDKINGKILRANNLLLFFLSLIPFTTGWMAENHFASNTVILYGILLICCAISYTIMTLLLVKLQGKESAFAKAIDADRKGKLSLIVYILGTIISFSYPLIGLTLFGLVALMRFIPDQRLEKTIDKN